MRFLCEVKEFVKKDAYIYFISSSKSDLTQLNEYIKKLSFKNEILAKKHIFFEDIILNKLEIVVT